MADAPDVLTVDPSPIDAPRVGEILRRTAPWAKFVAILYCIGAGLMVLVGIGAALMGLATRQPRMIVLMAYPLFGILYLIPAMYLLRFARQARGFATGHQSRHLEEALDAQRSYWKFMGILMIITFVCVLLLFGAGLVAGLWLMRTRMGG